MKFRKKVVTVLLIGGGMLTLSGQASAHWSSGPFLYNDAGTNPMNLANSNLALGVTNNGVGAVGTGQGTNVNTGTTPGSYTQTRATSSDYGWIQGQHSSLWANSHDNKGLAFSLASPSKVSFQINTLGTQATTIQAQATGGTTVTTLSGKDWTPAFALFQGLATQSSHEGGIGNDALDDHLPGYISWGPYAAQNPYSSATEAAYEANTGESYSGSGTWGAYRSNGDWYAGRDISATATFGNGNLIGTDQTVGGENIRKLDFLASETAAPGTHNLTSIEYLLQPGDYSIWVGGNNPLTAAQQLINYNNRAALIADGKLPTDPEVVAIDAQISSLRASYGFNITTTVAPVPVPAAVWLFGSALAGLVGFTRRKSVTAA